MFSCPIANCKPYPDIQNFETFTKHMIDNHPNLVILRRFWQLYRRNIQHEEKELVELVTLREKYRQLLLHLDKTQNGPD